MSCLLLVLASAAGSSASTVYVSCDKKGDDNHSGSLQAPFRTLEKARMAMRSSMGGTVWIRGGVCELPTPLQLTKDDSNVRWSAYKNEKVLLSGGVQIHPEKFTAANNGVNGVMQIDLKTQNITDYGTLKGRGYAGGSACILVNNFESSALELYYRPEVSSNTASAAQMRLMTLARYPNLKFPVATTNWAKVRSVSGSVLSVDADMAKRMGEGKWAQQEDIWTHGLWGEWIMQWRCTT